MRTAEEIGAALGCTGEAGALLVASVTPSPGLEGTRKVALAFAAALHREAGIDASIAAAIARSRRTLCEALLSTLDFVPPSIGGESATERDPFIFFAPHAADALAVPAIDHYVDVLDGRRIRWRRPRKDPYRVACELHRLSTAVRNDDTPALQEEYLELLAGLRAPVEQVSEWIGTVRDGAFRPAPNRFAEPSPGMREGLAVEADPARYANLYGTCVSINVSLAARSFKRWILGLDVTDPFDRRSAATSKTKRTRVPG